MRPLVPIAGGMDLDDEEVFMIIFERMRKDPGAIPPIERYS